MKYLSSVCLLSVLLAATPAAEAGTKEELVRLQTDVLALQNQIRELEKSFSDQTQGLRSLVVQLTDQTGKMNLLLEKISVSLDARVEGNSSEDQAVLQEIRNISAKLDDTTTRMSALAQSISDLKVQTKSISPTAMSQGDMTATDSGLSADAIYNQAFNDFIQGNFDLAIQGFTAYIRNFPNSDKADDAQYSIGEAYYNQNKMPQAIASFTRVINDYSGGDKTATALFKRAKAELAMQEKDNAIADFKTVVQKYGSAPEAALAGAELTNLGVSVPKPAAPRRKP
jgi:tol-pal system protein YbgF